MTVELCISQKLNVPEVNARGHLEAGRLASGAGRVLQVPVGSHNDALGNMRIIGIQMDNIGPFYIDLSLVE